MMELNIFQRPFLYNVQAEDSTAVLQFNNQCALVDS